MVRHRLAWSPFVACCALVACSGSSAPSLDEPIDSAVIPSGDTASTSDGGSDSSSSGDTIRADDSASSADGAPPPDAPISTTDFTKPGPHPVGKKDATVAGNAVHCVYPTDTPPSGGFPAVAFAHGFQLQTTGYDLLLSHLASWGFVVVSTDYPGSLFSIDHREVAKALTAARTAMAAGSIVGLPKVDGAHVAAAGHSLGGKGAVMAVLADPAFVAALTFDPVDGNPGNPLGGSPDAAHPLLNPTQTAALKVPIGYFGATQSRCGATACAPAKLDAAAFDASTPSSTPHHLWTVWDFGHMQFLDNPSCGFTCSVCAAGKSPIDPRRVAIHATSVAFLARYLAGDASAQTWLDGAKRAELVTATSWWDGKSALPACP